MQTIQQAEDKAIIEVCAKVCKKINHFISLENSPDYISYANMILESYGDAFHKKSSPRVHPHYEEIRLDAQILIALAKSVGRINFDHQKTQTELQKEEFLSKDSTFVFSNQEENQKFQEGQNIKYLNRLLNSFKNNSESHHQILYDSLEYYIKDRPKLLKEYYGKVVFIGATQYKEKSFPDFYIIFAANRTLDNTKDKIFLRIGHEALPTNFII